MYELVEWLSWVRNECSFIDLVVNPTILKEHDVEVSG